MALLSPRRVDSFVGLFVCLFVFSHSSCSAVDGNWRLKSRYCNLDYAIRQLDAPLRQSMPALSYFTRFVNYDQQAIIRRFFAGHGIWVLLVFIIFDKIAQQLLSWSNAWYLTVLTCHVRSLASINAGLECVVFPWENFSISAELKVPCGQEIYEQASLLN